MRNRLSQRRSTRRGETSFITKTGKQTVLAERNQQGDCTYCPPNRNENENGHHGKWGRKVASKTLYTTGKGRKPVKDWPCWNLRDIRYDKSS